MPQSSNPKSKRRWHAAAGMMLAAAAFAACYEVAGPVILSAPAGVTASLVNPTTARVDWTLNPAAEGVVSYNVVRNGTRLATVAAPPYIDTGLDELATYKYVVSANGPSSGVSPQSAESAAATVVAPDVTAPRVMTSLPAPNATGVATATSAAVTFSEAIDPNSLNGSTFSLRTSSSGVLLPGAVTYNAANRTAEFRPASPLPSGADVTGTATTGVKDLAGNAMAEAYVWSFSVRDEIAPAVVSVTPANAAANVPISTTVVATFSEAVSPATVNGTTVSLKVTATGASVPGSVTYNPATNSVSFTPSAALANSTAYSFGISAGVTEVGGNPLAPVFASSFTTVALLDTTAPVVTGTTPANGALNVAVNTSVTAVFSEPMNGATINASTVVLRLNATGAPVPGSVTYNSATNSAVFAPASALANSAQYTMTLSTAVSDTAGNGLASEFAFGFNTVGETTAPTVQAVSPQNNAIGISIATAVSVTFSEAMDPSTISASTVSLAVTASGAAVAGVVSYSSGTNAALFTPSAALANSTEYTVTVSTAVRDASGNALAAPFTSRFTTVAPSDNIAPTVTTTLPLNGATSAGTNFIITATFSEPMDPATINSSTFTLKNTATTAALDGIVTYNPGTNTTGFNLLSPLANNTNYTATVTTGAKDVAGNGLAANYVFSFTTESPADATPPTVQSVSPGNGATGVSTGAAVTITFSEPMNGSTISGSTVGLVVTAGGAAVGGAVAFNGSNTATFTPSAALSGNTGYTVTVSTGVKDIAGNSLASGFTSSFTTVAPADGTAPTVTSVSPVTRASNAGAQTPVSVTFSEPMNGSTFNASTFKVTDHLNGDLVGGSYAYSGTTATFTPSAPYDTRKGYLVTVTTGVTDASGNGLAAEFTSCFTPGPGSGTTISVTGFWSGNTSCIEVHWHVMIDQTGNTLSRRPVCDPPFCTLAAQNPTGQAVLGGALNAQVTALTGTVNGDVVSFTFTTDNGLTFSFSGSFAALPSGGNSYLTGTLSGATMQPIGINWDRQGQ